MNPADQAQIAQAQFNADMARRDAGNLMDEASANAQLFVQKENQNLATGVAALGKTGNLGFTKNELPTSGVGLGATDTKESLDLKKQYQGDVSAADAARTTVMQQAASWGFKGTYEDLLKSGANIPKSELDIIEKGKNSADALNSLPTNSEPSVALPDAAAYASGSDLLTLVTTKDLMERDKRTMMRSAQNDAVAMLKTGANYDAAAGYASQAAQWNTWNTILGTGLKIAGLFL
jgi:hypothetical protein